MGRSTTCAVNGIAAFPFRNAFSFEDWPMRCRWIIIPCVPFILGVVAPLKGLAGEKKDPLVGKLQPALVAQLGHALSVNSVSLSSDGKWLATGSTDGTARLWEMATGKEVRAFQGLAAQVASVSLSGDGKWLATGGSDNIARLWEVATGKEARAFHHGRFSWVTSVSLSDDGKWLVTSALDKTTRLWEVATGKEVHAFRGHPGIVRAVSLSRDGKWLVTGSDDNTARLWEVATGKEVRIFHGHTARVNSVSLSGDAKWLVTGSNDNTARLWDVTTGAEFRMFQGHTDKVHAVALSTDGKLVVTGSNDKTARLWDLANGKEIRVFRGHAVGINAVALSTEGRSLVTGSIDKTARLWDVDTGKSVRIFEGQSNNVKAVAVTDDGHRLVTLGGLFARSWEPTLGMQTRSFRPSEGVTAIALSEDGKSLATGGYGKIARLWQLTTGKEIRAFQGRVGYLTPVSLSRDGKWLVTASKERTARLWEVTTGMEIRAFSGHTSDITAVSVSGDAIWLVTASDDKTARLWELATGKEVRVFQGHTRRITSASISGDGKWLVTGSDDKTARLWEVATGKEVRAFQGHSSGVTSVSLSRHGKWLVTGSWDATARMWDVSTGKEIRAFRGHSHMVSSVSFSGDGKWLVTGSWDHTTRWWDVASGTELCRLISFRDHSWAVVDSDGRFDAANSGNVEGLHWVAGMEIIALSQLKQRYYDPGLLAKHLGFNKEPLRNVEAFREVKLHPAIEAVAPAAGSNSLTLKLANRGGGIGKVQVFVNGRELTADARAPKFDANAVKATTNVDLAGAVVLPGEKNHVRIVAWNSEGYLSSRGLDLDWIAPGRKDEQPIELHAIVVGVSDYASDALKLRYPGKDAADIAKALQLGGKRLFGADKTHVTLLCDGGPAGALSPTRENIERAFTAARKCRPTDVLVVYLAGHGVALQEQGQEIYCYLTREARAVNQDSFRDPAVRRQAAVTSAELTEWFKKIPALKQVLILDTCAAGAAAGKLIEHRDISADQIRAIDRLRDRTGFHVLMGCAADRVSYEATRYSQGVLTYALLQGMRGAKLRDGEFIDVMELFLYAADQVPQLAQHIGGIQKPLVMAPRGTSFDIGQLKKEDQQQIPLALVRPLLLRPHLINADKDVLDDDLGLKGRLRQRLNDASHAAARGKGGPAAVYVDADEMPGAVRPTGSYTVEGKTVRVRLNLRRDGQNVATLEVDGTRDELDALADRLAAAILKNLKNP
jgi:WD40 repeat protein